MHKGTIYVLYEQLCSWGDGVKETGLPRSDGRTPHHCAGASLNGNRIWGARLKGGKNQQLS